MKNLKKSEKDLIVKINEFRSFAQNIATYAKATDIMRELIWLLSKEDCEALQSAWKAVYVDFGEELELVCNSIISKIEK